jgi:large-conductance mechanosensitive channel
MTANQIMIPMTLVAFAIFVLWQVVKSRRDKKANEIRDHRPNTPPSQQDRGAIARSVAHGKFEGGHS